MKKLALPLHQTTYFGAFVVLQLVFGFVGNSSGSVICSTLAPSGAASRIICGDKYTLNEVPHIAAIYGSRGYSCSGAIMNEWYILTAAHCVCHFNKEEPRKNDPCIFARKENMSVSVGSVKRRSAKNTTSDSDSEKADIKYRLKVDKIRAPRKYTCAKLKYPDVALMRLEKELDLKAHPDIKPINLLGDAEPDKKKFQRCYVTGWGGQRPWGSATKPPQIKPSPPDVLLGYEVKLLSDKDCNLAFKNVKYAQNPPFQRTLNKVNVTKSTRAKHLICVLPATDDKNYQSTCKGDSGGPVTCVDAKGDSYLIGLVHGGFGCGVRGVPKFATRIGYKDTYTWITRFMKDVNKTDPEAFKSKSKRNCAKLEDDE